jgi:hypothetical protein
VSDDRSDRLRKRRQTRDPDPEQEDVESSDRDNESDSRGGTAATDSDTESVTVKEALQGIYLYGDPDQKDRIDMLYNRLKADYEYEYDDTLGKNEHFYRVLLEVGLEGLESMDVSELQARLEELESLESLYRSDN